MFGRCSGRLGLPLPSFVCFCGFFYIVTVLRNLFIVVYFIWLCLPHLVPYYNMLCNLINDTYIFLLLWWFTLFWWGFWFTDIPHGTPSSPSGGGLCTVTVANRVSWGTLFPLSFSRNEFLLFLVHWDWLWVALELECSGTLWVNYGLFTPTFSLVTFVSERGLCPIIRLFEFFVLHSTSLFSTDR